jgi:hypothetical protein
MAMQDTALVIDLPLGSGATIHRIRFGSDGNIVEDMTTTLSNPLRANLNQYELLIVEPD